MIGYSPYVFNTLSRYVLREMLIPFVLALVVLTFVVLIHQVLRLMDLLINKGIGLSNIVKAFVLILPSFFLITLPMAVLIASLIAFSRLSFDHELVALRSLGVGFGRLLAPLLLFSGAVTLLSLFLAFVAEPLGGRAFKELTRRVIQQRAAVGVTPGTFNTFSDQIILYIDAMPTYDEIEGVLISDVRRSEDPLLIVARRGRLVNHPDQHSMHLLLQEGAVHHRSNDMKTYQRLAFDQYDLSIDLSPMLPSPLGGAPVPSYRQLRENVHRTDGKDVGALRALQDYYKNFTFASACLLLGLMGAPLGMVAGRASRMGGFASAVVMIALYYLLTMVGDFLVSSRTAPPLLGAVLPNLLLLPPLAYLLNAGLKERLRCH